VRLFVRDGLDEDWLLFDNQNDPYQQNSLVHSPVHASVLEKMSLTLDERLMASGDEFKAGEYYLDKWGYVVNETGTVPYAH
jgi:hypothetical protein